MASLVRQRAEVSRGVAVYVGNLSWLHEEICPDLPIPRVINSYS